jgi:hypothetical protein
MSDWTHGYVADVGYTYGYYGELNPLNAEFALLEAGLLPPKRTTACELGFGQGLSINIHAAASTTEWYGTDFNPAQAAFAQELAQASGAKVSVYDDAFAEFAHRPDLPDFDFIGVHGIWSWISDENRRVIVDFVRRKLRVGGVLYVSYNTMPGWSAFAPIRHLITEHAEVMGASGRGLVPRINDALDFASKLVATNPIFARANPQIVDRLTKLQAQNRHYLAHEYFNRDWHPMHFATMAEWLQPAKVQYAGSASYIDHIDLINLTSEQQAFLKEIPDRMFRESARDFMVNQQFRRDYWIKGVRPLTGREQRQRIRALKFILTTHRPDVPLKIMGAMGEGNLNEPIYGPILDALADHKPCELGQLEKNLRGKGINFVQLFQAMIALVGSSHLARVQDEAIIDQARPQTKKLNTQLMEHAKSGGDVIHLASPVTGGGIVIDRFQQLFLLARREGLQRPDEWAAFAWRILAEQEQKILKDGKTLQTPEENLAEMNVQAKEFAEKRLMVMEGAGIT